MESQKDQAQLQLKAEELNIRKARFMEGVKQSENKMLEKTLRQKLR